MDNTVQRLRNNPNRGWEILYTEYFRKLSERCRTSRQTTYTSVIISTGYTINVPTDLTGPEKSDVYCLSLFVLGPRDDNYLYDEQGILTLNKD